MTEHGLTPSKLAKATEIINAWFDKQNYLDEPDFILHKWLNQPNYYPEGHPVRYDREGDDNVFWFEGCPIDEWALACAVEIQPELDKIGVWAEPYYSFALSIYKA